MTLVSSEHTSRLPLLTDSAHDMLSAGDGAGVSAGTVTHPREVVESAVSAAPDDASEGDKLNLPIHIASTSTTDMVLELVQDHDV